METAALEKQSAVSLALNGGQALKPFQPEVLSESASMSLMLMRAASDPAIDIDKLERLYQLREQIIAREAKTAFQASLAQMQQHLPVITARGKIVIRDKTTKEVIQSSAFATWADINEAVGPVLSEFGFALTFKMEPCPDGKILVTGFLTHKDGHAESTAMPFMHDSSGSKNAVQAIGSSVSYGKRYTACALLNITSRAEADDDGSAAGEPEGPKLITEAQADELRDLMESVNADTPKFLRFLKVSTLSDLPADRFGEAVAQLERKRAK